jgi:hypothetical protein
MGTYVPVITSANGNISIFGDGATTYEEFVNSMNGFLYKISGMYVQATTPEQLLQPIAFSEFDSNGNIEDYTQIVTINPYQYQNSSLFNLTKDNVILNGRTSLSFNVLPSEIISMVFYVDQIANKDFINKTDIFDNDFFKDYATFIQ